VALSAEGWVQIQGNVCGSYGVSNGCGEGPSNASGSPNTV
jgi:hypothetical protein